MKKLMPFIFCVLGIGIGFVLGSGWILRKHTYLEWHWWSSSNSTQANLAVATLRSIRSGDTNKAVERMEIELDRAVLGLADSYRVCPLPKDLAIPVDTLIRARNYRAENPRKTLDSFVDKAVAEAFDLASQAQTNFPVKLSPAERGYDPNLMRGEP